MKTKTIRKLNQINSDFYTSIATEFSDSRNYPWQGWTTCLPDIQAIANAQELSVADIGCGNGRFGLFLNEKITNPFAYTGIDNNPELLQITQKTLTDKKNISSLTTTPLDLVDALISDSVENSLVKNNNNEQYSLITVFGVMHHIPSLKLRKKLVQTLTNMLSKNGILVLTYWQFMKDERFAYKQVPATELGIDEDDLESGDYILDWKRGKLAYRYFHHSSEKEQQEIVTATQNIKIKDTFLSDGKSEDLNAYWVLTKK